MSSDRFTTLNQSIKDFVCERDWSQFHSIKNLGVGVVVEAGELLEILQWTDPKDSSELSTKQLEDLKDESADVLIYLCNFASKLGFDLIEAAHRKLEKNRAKYPVDKAKGNSKKYNEL